MQNVARGVRGRKASLGTDHGSVKGKTRSDQACSLFSLSSLFSGKRSKTHSSFFFFYLFIIYLFFLLFLSHGNTQRCGFPTLRFQLPFSDLSASTAPLFLRAGPERKGKPKPQSLSSFTSFPSSCNPSVLETTGPGLPISSLSLHPSAQGLQPNQRSCPRRMGAGAGSLSVWKMIWVI